jgi:hypothetical protein
MSNFERRLLEQEQIEKAAGKSALDLWNKASPEARRKMEWGMTADGGSLVLGGADAIIDFLVMISGGVLEPIKGVEVLTGVAEHGLGYLARKLINEGRVEMGLPEISSAEWEKNRTNWFKHVQTYITNPYGFDEYEVGRQKKLFEYGKLKPSEKPLRDAEANRVKKLRDDILKEEVQNNMYRATFGYTPPEDISYPGHPASK